MARGARRDMYPALDHVFVMCDADAPEASALAKIGLVEGSRNVHPGQGTACRRFLFPQQYLELLWVRHAIESQNDATRPTRLWDRWSARRTGACPFGLVFRRGTETDLTLPFPTWSYRPGYLPEGLAIEIAVETPIEELEFFFLPPVGRRAEAVRPAQPALPGATITHLRLGTPTGAPVSSAAHWAGSLGLVSFERSDEYVLTVTFDQGSRGNTADARPTLPLVLRW